MCAEVSLSSLDSLLQYRQLCNCIKSGLRTKFFSDGFPQNKVLLLEDTRLDVEQFGSQQTSSLIL